jgi:hypothetical protein
MRLSAPNFNPLRFLGIEPSAAASQPASQS